MKRHTLSAALLSVVLMFVLASAWGTPALAKQRNEQVTIVLRNGDKIRATILDIWRDKIVFKADNWRDAYEYGEVIGVGQIAAIELDNGKRLSVAEYDDYRKGKTVRDRPEKAEPVSRDTKISDRVIVTRSPERQSTAEEIDQYELLKRKPISEMSDREFEFFMMMKRRELEEERLKRRMAIERERRQVQAERSDEVEEVVEPTKVREPEVSEPVLGRRPSTLGRGVARPTNRRFGLRLPPRVPERDEADAARQMARLLIDSDLAGPFLKFVAERQGEPLTPFQRNVVSAVESSPEWRDRVEEVEYLSRVASKALERVFLYEPQSLKTNLGLTFDENADVDFDDLLRQLHGKLGNDVKMGDFRVLVDVLGEGGARAVRDLLRNFDTYRYVKAAGGAVARK